MQKSLLRPFRKMALPVLAASMLVAPLPTALAQQPAVRVITTTATTQPFAYSIEALGTARANESIEITSKVSEVVARVRFEEGQAVEVGQVLVELASEELQAELAVAQANAAESRSQYERGLGLTKTRTISPSELQQLQAVMEVNDARVAAARARLANHVIRAPFAGRVGLRRISPGGLVSPGTVITTLDDMDPIKLDFELPETVLAALQAGLPVQARSVAYRDRVFSGTVASIDTRVDPVTRSVAARALIDNKDGLLKPGMFLNVTVLRSADQALVIPEEALVPVQDRQYLFVIEEGLARQRQVRIGRRSPGKVEILQGLSAGEEVVVEGTQGLREGTPVEIVQRRDAGAAD